MTPVSVGTPLARRLLVVTSVLASPEAVPLLRRTANVTRAPFGGALPPPLEPPPRPSPAHGEEDLLAGAPPAPRLLVTTAYWKIRSKRGEPAESDALYSRCMGNVMSLQAPLVTYGDAYGLQEMHTARSAAGLSFLGEVQASISDLPPCASYRQDLWGHPDKYTNLGDVPSVSLGCLWDGKPGMLAQSARDHPEYDWYAWLDVCMGHGAIPFHHNNQPWPSPERLNGLPSDRISVSWSEEDDCESCREGWTYCHCLAGTAFVVPRSLVDQFSTRFSQTVRECLQAFSEQEVGAYVCLSDQVILTKLYLQTPALFSVGSSGYGAVAVEQLT